SFVSTYDSPREFSSAADVADIKANSKHRTRPRIHSPLRYLDARSVIDRRTKAKPPARGRRSRTASLSVIWLRRWISLGSWLGRAPDSRSGPLLGQQRGRSPDSRCGSLLGQRGGRSPDSRFGALLGQRRGRSRCSPRHWSPSRLARVLIASRPDHPP